MRPLLAVIVAYLLGSIPFGYLIVRAKAGRDVRRTGSGGTGATNVSRSAGKLAGLVTLVLDAFKGAAAVVTANLMLSLGDQPVANADWWVSLAAIAVIAGHIFPLWLGFRGGKGVATGAGVFMVLTPTSVLFAGVIFIAIFFLTRYVSLSSIIAAAIIPLFVWVQSYFQPGANTLPLLSAAIVGAALIVWAHRGNIGRLVSGTESKFK
jgi:acyl phosphate:glycerol-3-phosphate acyltransferase